MANNFGLGFIFEAIDKFSGTVGRVENAHKRVQAAAQKTNAVMGGARDNKGRFLPKGGLGASPTGNGRDANGRFLPKGVNGALGSAAQGVQRVERGLFAMAKKAALSRLSVQALGTALGNLGAGAVTGAFRGITAGFAGSASASIDFESAMADVNKVLPEGTALQPIADGAKQLAKDIGIVPNQVAALTASLAQSGIAGDELLKTAGDASRLAVAFGISGEESGQALAKLRTGLGLTRPEVNSLTGTINELSNNLAATAPEITDGVQRIGGIAKAANISGASTAALVTSMIASGASSEIAATGTKNFIRALGAGDAATKKQREAFKALGLDSQSVAKQLTMGGESAETAIKDVVSRIADLDQEDKLPNLIRLFGSESIGAIGPLATNITLLTKAFGIAGDETAAAGSVQKEFETRAKTTGFAIDKLKANFSVLAIEMGDSLMPIVRGGINALNWMIEKTRDWRTALGALGSRISDFASNFQVFKDLRLVFDGLVQVFSEGGFSGAVRKELNSVENSGIKKFIIRVYMLFGRLRVFFEGVASGFVKAWEVVGPKITVLFENLKKIAVTFFSIFADSSEEVTTSSMSSWREWGDALAGAIGWVADMTVSLVGWFAALLAENNWLVKGLFYGYVALKMFRVGMMLVRGAAIVSAAVIKGYTVAVKLMGIGMKVGAIGMKIFRFGLLGVTMAMKALRLATLSNPIIALITGLVVGAVLIYKYWEPIKQFFADLWDGITAAFKTAIDWILETIDWVGDKVEEFLVSVMTPEQAEMYVKLKEEETILENKDSALFADDLDARVGTSSGAGPRNDALSRAQVEAARAPNVSATDRLRMGASAAAANAGLAAQAMGRQIADAREMNAANAATGGGDMSINLVVDGERLASTMVKKGKASKARTFSNVDPRDEDE